MLGVAVGASRPWPPSVQEEATLSRELHTPGLSLTHVPVGYRGQCRGWGPSPKAPQLQRRHRVAPEQLNGLGSQKTDRRWRRLLPSLGRLPANRAYSFREAQHPYRPCLFNGPMPCLFLSCPLCKDRVLPIVASYQPALCCAGLADGPAGPVQAGAGSVNGGESGSHSLNFLAANTPCRENNSVTAPGVLGAVLTKE